MKHLVRGLAPILFVPFAVVAETPATLDPITVTATGTEVAASEVLASQLVITRAEIEHAQARDLAELLQFYAGLEVERYGGSGQLTQLRIRGGEADHTLILVDGVRFNPATGGPVLQNLPTGVVERIEIVKGPRSTLYGSDAMTGTIHIITRRDGATSVALRGGRYGTQEGSLFYSAGGEDAHLGLSLEALRADGPPVCADTNAVRPYDRQSLSVNGGIKLSGVQFGARAFHSQGQSDYLAEGCPGGSTPLDQDFRQQTLALDAEFAPTARWQTRLSASQILDDLQQNQSTDFIKTTRPGLDWHNVLAISESHRLSFGASYAQEEADVLSFGAGIRENRDIKSARLQDEWNQGVHHALLAGAVTDHEAFGTRGTWNAEYGYDASAELRLVVAGGSGFRAPNAFERLSGFGGNPDLKPEFARNFEWGAILALAPGHHLDLRNFRTTTRDLIIYDGAQNLNVNVPEHENQGTEVSYRYVSTCWSLALSGLNQDPKNVTEDQRLQRRAKRAASARVERRFGPHYLAVDVLGSSDRLDTAFDPVTFAATPVTLPGYALVNLGAGYQFTDSLSVQAKLENALDTEYQTVFGYRQSGAAAYVGLRWQP